MRKDRWNCAAFAPRLGIRLLRQQNSTSLLRRQIDQWRYEKLKMDEVIRRLLDARLYGGSMIDYVPAHGAGCLDGAQDDLLQVARDAQARAIEEYAVKALKDGAEDEL